MLLLLLLGLAIVYFSLLFWLPGRFKNKPWHRKWFWGVILVLGVLPWLDQILIYAYVKNYRCKADAAQLGRYTYMPFPIEVPAKDVTWLKEHTFALEKEVREGEREILIQPVVSCINSKGEDQYCLVEGASRNSIREPMRFLGLKIAKIFSVEYRYYNQITSRSLIYTWKSSLFLKALTGVYLPSFTQPYECGTLIPRTMTFLPKGP